MKVLGASSIRIGLEMYSEFFIIAGVAAVIATPLGLKLVELWLSNFFYRAPVSMINGIIAISAAFFVMFVTVSINYYRVLKQTPVHILNQD